LYVLPVPVSKPATVSHQLAFEPVCMRVSLVLKKNKSKNCMIVEKGKAEVAMFSFFEVGKKSKTLCGVV
jgi:hypothetical protein